MTVTYYPKIATIKFAVTLRLLGRWKGSLYKLVFPDVAMFCAIYTTISLVYRFALTDEQRTEFDKICIYVREYSGTTTVTFCLGFFVSYVLGRWWEYFKTMPWMYTPGYHIRQAVVPPFAYQNKRKTAEQQPESQDCSSSLSKRKQFEEAMQIRLHMVRYLLLGWIWMMRRISKPVLIRFKPHENFSESKLIDKLHVMNCDPFIQKYFPKLLTDTEIDAVVAYAKRIVGDDYEKYEPDHWVPLDWASDLVHDARARGYIPNDFLAQDLLETFREYRGGLGMLRFMDMFNVPLVYTQVVALCMYIYLLLNCFATQFIDKNKPDVYVPVPFILQLTFLFGWLRVSEVCLNPFGEDDDDFPTWQILNMNLETAFRIVNVFDYDLVDDASTIHEHKQPTRKGPSTTDCTAARTVLKRRISTQSGRSYPNSSLLPSLNGLHAFEHEEPQPHKADLNVFHFDEHRTSAAGSVHSISAPQQQDESDEFETEMNDRLRANYERFKRKYDRPSYLGSAIENELSSKNQHHQHPATPDLPRRTQSKLSLGVSRLVTDLMHIPAHLVNSPSKSNLTSSSSRHDLNTVTHQKHTEDERLLHSVHAHESDTLMRNSQLSLASTDAYKHCKRHVNSEEHAQNDKDRRSRHTSIVIAPLASAILRSHSTHAPFVSTPSPTPAELPMPVLAADLHSPSTETASSLRNSRQLQFGTLSDSKHSLNKIAEAAEPQSPSSSLSTETALINLNQDNEGNPLGSNSDAQQALPLANSKRRRTGLYASGDCLGLKEADNAPLPAATSEALSFIDQSDNAEER